MEKISLRAPGLSKQSVGAFVSLDIFRLFESFQLQQWLNVVPLLVSCIEMNEAALMPRFPMPSSRSQRYPQLAGASFGKI